MTHLEENSLSTGTLASPKMEELSTTCWYAKPISPCKHIRTWLKSYFMVTRVSIMSDCLIMSLCMVMLRWH